MALQDPSRWRRHCAATLAAFALALTGSAHAAAAQDSSHAQAPRTSDSAATATRARDGNLISSTLTADSATRAALASRLPRDRMDTVAAFPIRRLATGVYAVIGDTGRGSEGRSNAGFIVTDSGVVVIDALASPGQGDVLLRTIRKVTPLPVRWLILTHHHPDHTFGAIVFKRLGARIIAHPDRRTLASADGDDALVSGWSGVLGLRQMHGFEFADTPDIPVVRDTTLVLGGRAIALLHPGAAHTAGDLMIWLPGERVLFAGDILVEDGVTMVVDGNSGVLLATLDTIQALRPAVVLPGHGRIPDRPSELVDLTACYMLGLRSAMRSDVEQGVRMGRALAALPPADRDRPISRASRQRRNAVRVYNEMEIDVMNGGTTASSRAEAARLSSCPQ